MRLLFASLAVPLTGLAFFLAKEKRTDPLEKQFPQDKPLLGNINANARPTSESVTQSAHPNRRISVTKPVQFPSMVEAFENEESRVFLRNGIKISLPISYGDFIETLGLSSNENDYFLDLLTSRLFERQHLQAKWLQASDPERTVISRRIERFNEENTREIDQFLQSSADSTAFQKYERRICEHRQLSGVKNEIAGIPISPVKKEQLVDLLYQARLNSGLGSGSDTENWQSLARAMDFTSIVKQWNDADVEIAENIQELLLPPQAEAFLKYWKGVRVVQINEYESGMLFMGLIEK